MLLFDFNIRPKPIFVRRLSVDHNLVEVCKIWETKLTFTSYPRFDVSNNLLFLCRYHSKHDWFLKSITGYCTRDSFQRSILNTTHVYYIHKCTFLLWFHAIYIYILDSERSEECICFKMMCFFFFYACIYQFYQKEWSDIYGHSLFSEANCIHIVGTVELLFFDFFLKNNLTKRLRNKHNKFWKIYVKTIKKNRFCRNQ